MCINKKVVAGLGVVALGLLALSPRLLGASLPLLVMAACPLSMVLMMRRMGGGSSCSTTAGSAERATVDASRPASEAVDQDAEIRELQEEVNRLRAELHLRSDQPSA